MTTLTKSPAPPSTPTRPLGERLSLRLIVFLAIIAVPFAWCAWLVLDNRMIVDKGDHYAVDLKGMGNFPFDAARDDERAIPKDVLALDGKRVKFEGEMYAPDSAGGVQSFQLVYSIVECCMGGPPKVQERVFAFAPPGKTVPNYSGSQVTVIGTLHVKVVKPQDKGDAVSVFTMDVDEIRQRS